jgi:hypothetical protein
MLQVKRFLALEGDVVTTRPTSKLLSHRVMSGSKVVASDVICLPIAGSDLLTAIGDECFRSDDSGLVRHGRLGSCISC